MKQSLKVASKLIAAATVVALAPTVSANAASDEQVVNSKSVGVQMFEWNWNSLAKECTTNLGPAGYDWVEVSPPQEHIVGSEWWIHYQPVSYKIESKLGTRAEFTNMVETCGKAGVSVIADAVINHMAASDTIGWAGTKHTKYDYPGLYTESDFHKCTSASGGIENWNSISEVQECELLGLSDLNTGSATVQAKIVAYLKDLLSLGVKGFRIDAAKHIASEELKQIVDALPSGTSFLHEVYEGAENPANYREIGNTFGFNWARSLTSMFDSPGQLNGQATSSVLKSLEPSEATISIVTNHDTERDRSTLSYSNGARFELANMLMLSLPYGKPMVFSGYAFSDRDSGPAVQSNGSTADVVCPTKPAAATAPRLADGRYVCTHRWPGITGMVQWRKAVGDAKVQGVYNKSNTYGFSRGKLGFVFFNSSWVKFSKPVKTSLPAGIYCNAAVTGYLGSKVSCASSARVTVAKDGTAKLTVAPWSAVAISAASKLK